MNITSDELLAAITAACNVPRTPPPSDPGASVQALAKHWKCGVHTARRKVNAALEAGTLIAGTAYTLDRAGRMVPSPVYRPRE